MQFAKEMHLLPRVEDLFNCSPFMSLPLCSFLCHSALNLFVVTLISFQQYGRGHIGGIL
jgi:hypothetical protein